MNELPYFVSNIGGQYMVCGPAPDHRWRNPSPKLYEDLSEAVVLSERLNLHALAVAGGVADGPSSEWRAVVEGESGV